MTKDVGISPSSIIDFNRLLSRKNSDLGDMFDTDTIVEKLLGAIIAPATLASIADGLLQAELTQPHSRIAATDSAHCISLRGCVENRTVQRGCADSTVATVATHTVGEGGKRQRRLACYVHTVATA